MRRALPAVALAGWMLIGAACDSSPVPDTTPSVRPSAAAGNESVAPRSLEPGTTPGDSVGSNDPGFTPDPGASPGESFDQAYGAAQPVDVSVELSSITFTTTVTEEHGGFLTVLGPDGTFYQLDVPPSAVLSDLDVTMTVVSAIGGSPLGDKLIGAVKLEPAGLQFNLPPTLTIVPTTPIPVAEEGPFNADSDGRDFHLYPLDADPSAVRMHLMHFSIFGLFQTDLERRNEMIRKTARDVGSQLEQEIAQAAEEAREKGENIDPEKAGPALDYYRDRVLRPMMQLAGRDHTLFRQALQRWLSWERHRQLILQEEYDGLDPQILKSAQTAFMHYVDETKERCYEHDFGAIHDLMALAKQIALLGDLLGEFSQSDVFEFVDKCATFTLEMDSTMEADLNTCMFIDAGASDVNSEERLTTAVEIRVQQGAPWSGPMQWQSATYDANCRLPAQNGGNLISCEMHFVGFADAGEFAVLRVDLDLNNINRPPPPPPPPPKPSPGPSAFGPSPSVLPSGPPTPKPTEAPEETISELHFRGVLVQPGDPQIFHDGSCKVLGFSGGSQANRGSGSWLAGWKDNTATVPREFVRHPQYGEAYWLRGWEYVANGDELARADYDGGTNSFFGTTTEDTTFIIRHTPRR